jgi:hypothetical protein
LDCCIAEAAAWCLSLGQCYAALDGHIGAVGNAGEHALGHWVAPDLLEASNRCDTWDGNIRGCREQWQEQQQQQQQQQKGVISRGNSEGKACDIDPSLGLIAA